MGHGIKCYTSYLDEFISATLAATARVAVASALVGDAGAALAAIGSTTFTEAMVGGDNDGAGFSVGLDTGDQTGL